MYGLELGEYMKILFISLGCDKNLVDSEQMMGLLRDRGYEFTDDEETADVGVINTCGFISSAKEEHHPVNGRTQERQS